MELTLLNETKTELEVEIHGENETFLVPLLHRLLEDPKVDYATYMLGHILMDDPRIFVRVTKGAPREALDRAAESIKTDLTDLAAKFAEKAENFKTAPEEEAAA